METSTAWHLEFDFIVLLPLVSATATSEDVNGVNNNVIENMRFELEKRQLLKPDPRTLIKRSIKFRLCFPVMLSQRNGFYSRQEFFYYLLFFRNKSFQKLSSAETFCMLLLLQM